jgi:hypothetical protein
MKKAIVAISGSNSGKRRFSEVAKRASWLWEVNPVNSLTDVSKSRFYWDGERTDKYDEFMFELHSRVNSVFNFDEKYVTESIFKFNADESEYKEIGGNRFEKFLLVIHGINDKLINKLREDYGVFQLHITSSNIKTSEGNHDYILYEDADTFEEDIERTINVLTKG